MKKSELAGIQQLHQMNDAGTCRCCLQAWPCDSTRLLDHIKKTYLDWHQGGRRTGPMSERGLGNRVDILIRLPENHTPGEATEAKWTAKADSWPVTRAYQYVSGGFMVLITPSGPQ